MKTLFVTLTPVRSDGSCQLEWWGDALIINGTRIPLDALEPQDPDEEYEPPHPYLVGPIVQDAAAVSVTVIYPHGIAATEPETQVRKIECTTFGPVPLTP